MSTRVGYRIRGIEPAELALYPDPVKLMYWSWVVQFGLRAKDRDLAAGLDKDGIPLKPLSKQSIQHRKSEVGPTFKTAPPLEPSYGRSRVRSLLTGRAHTTSAEFWWRFDSVSGRSFSDILLKQQDQGRDVFGLSSAGTAWVKAQALMKWQSWVSKAGPPPATLVGWGDVTRDVPTPVRAIPLVGRTDLANMDLVGGKAEIRRVVKAGQFTGFRRLNAVGERWSPSYSAIGSAGQPPAFYTTTQRQAVEKGLGVPFKIQTRAAVARESTVLADVRKIEDQWARNQPADYIPTGGRGSAQAYERFSRELLTRRATGQPVEMPRVVIGKDGALTIRDGDVAFAVLRDQGAGVVPVTVPRSQANDFRREYGATAAQIRAAAAIGRPPGGALPIAAAGKNLNHGSSRGNPEPHIKRAADLIQKAGYEAVTDGSVEIQDVFGPRWVNVIAMFHPESGKIYLNEQHEHWENPAAYVRSHYRRKEPWFSSGSKDHLARHEIAHARHWALLDASEVDAFWNGKFNQDESLLIRRAVGEFATVSTGEFVAEVRAGLEAGKTYPEPILAIYDRLKGPR